MGYRFRTRSLVAGMALAWAGLSTAAVAADFPYNRNVTLKVGQTAILKGVRSGDCSDTAPTWAYIAGKLPKPKLGTLSDAGAGTTRSNTCGGRVGARGVRYKATKAGKESFIVYDDRISVTVQ